MHPRLLVAALAAATALGTAGCASQSDLGRKQPTYDEAAKHPFVPTNYRAAEALLSQLQGKLPSEQPLIIATVVNIDALDRSSTFGRLVSEQVSARFAKAGYRMVEMKFSQNVYMKRDQGEMMLTRELRNIAANHEAQAVIVGTYGESSELVFVNLKVIQPHSNVVMAVHDYVVPIDTITRTLLRSAR